MNGHHATLRACERLARSGPSQLEDARRSVTAILTSARSLTALLPDDAGADPVWKLARRLSHLPGMTSATTTPTDLAAADARFREVLVSSLESVRTCRQTLHVTGGCWFSDRPHTDGCGEVLRAAHALS